MKGLILKYLRGEISGAERQELDLWLDESPENQLLFDQMNDPDLVAKALAKMDTFHEEEIWNRIQAYVTPAVPGEHTNSLFAPASRRLGRYRAVAAAVILLLGLGIYGGIRLLSRNDRAIVQAPARDVAPGGNKATLTLSNGQQIILDSAHNGALAQQGGIQVMKTDSGQIAYNLLIEKPTADLYNSLATPRGGQYQLTLPDGTRVWLNAASSIRYPVFFTGSDRKVEITGEVYFEVTKNASKPFKVEIGGDQEVDVLGTSFDINAYGDEPRIKTTLLEGTVKTGGVTLKPGQQAAWSAGSPVIVQNDADVEEAVAWKNGKFIFTGNDIGSVMRQLARWYDVDVEYNGNFQDVELVGAISRFKNVSEILGMLEQTRTVKFAVEGRKITVLPYKN